MVFYDLTQGLYFFRSGAVTFAFYECFCEMIEMLLFGCGIHVLVLYKLIESNPNSGTLMIQMKRI